MSLLGCRKQRAPVSRSVARVALAACAAGVVSACFAPQIGEGQFACGPGGHCPSGYQCAADGRCYLPGQAPGDGGSPSDGPADRNGDRGDMALPFDQHLDLASDPPRDLSSDPVADLPAGEPPGDAGPDAMDATAVDPPLEGPPLTAVTVGIDPIENLHGVIDTTIKEADPTAHFDSDEQLTVSGASGARASALMHFDVGSLAGRQVVSAALRLDCTTAGSQLLVHALAIDFAAGANWNSTGLADWPIPGCVGATSAATAMCRVDPPFYISGDLALGLLRIPLPNDLVQGWIDQPDTNHGLYLNVNPNNFPGTMQFASSESRAAAHPRLELMLR